MPDILFSPVLIWAIVGVVCLIIELTTFTFVLCFLGAGAFIVSLTAWGGITPGIAGQLAVFSGSSLLSMILFRKAARRLFAGVHDRPPEYAGEKVKVVKTIPAGEEGAVRYRGSEWIAFSELDEAIAEGSTVEITAIEGIRVKVKPLQP